MKLFKYSLILALATLMFSSCLKSDLDDLPEYEDNNIVSVQRVEYRFVGSTTTVNGDPIVQFVTLRNSSTIDTKSKTVSIQVTVPAANSTFTESERAKCSVNNIAVMVQASTAARITPASGSPDLGVPADWSSPHQYVVKAADGSTETWTIQVTNFSK